MTHHTNSSKPSLIKSSSSNTPFTHGISRRKILSTIALGSTALAGMVNLKRATGVTDTLFSPAAAQGRDSTDSYRLNFVTFNGPSGTSPSGTSVTRARVSVIFDINVSGQVRSATNFEGLTTVDGLAFERVVQIGWEEGSSLVVGFGQESVFSPIEIQRWEDGIDEKFVRARITLVENFVEGTAEFIPSVSGIAPKVIRGTQGRLATVLPVLYRTGPETAFSIINPPTGVETLFQQNDENKLFFVGYYVKLHSGTAGWQYVPSRGGVTRDMKLEVPIVVGDDVQLVPLPSAVIVDRNTNSDPFLVSAFDGYLKSDQRVQFGDAQLLSASDFRTGFDTALDSAIIGDIPMGEMGEDARVKDPSALVRFFNSIPVTAPFVPTTPTTMMATTTDAPDHKDTNDAADIATPTTPTTLAATTVAVTTTIAATTITTLAATTVAVTTTIAATTMADTTTGGPTIAGELSVRGAINAQANIGANVSRSLSGRLSSFRAYKRIGR